MKRTYHGSCHCKTVTFEVDIDLEKGTGKCNCTLCWKQRMWNVGQLAKENFRLIAGEERLSDYGKSGDWGEGHHRFCSRCGVATHSHGRIDAMGGDLLSLQLATLDDLPVTELVSAPLHYMDGLHDNWQNPPAETRHL